MPTLENELEALKQALTVLQSRHISDIQQLNDRIDRVQQQIDEQKRRLFDQGLLVTQRFDTLESGLSQQFDAMKHSILRVDQQGLVLEQQVNKQTRELKEKFDTVDHFATKTYGIVYEQQNDVHAIRQQLNTFQQEVNQRFSDLNQEMYSGFERIDKRLDTHDKRFDSVDEKLNQIVALLTPKSE
jgi:predicted  nucleic acid-binding Zn-ribbon protein